MRRPFLLIGAVLLVLLGGLGWLAVQRFLLPEPSGEVRGVQTEWPAFWRDRTVFLTGNIPSRLMLFHEGQMTLAPIVQAKDIRQALVSNDQEVLLLVAAEGNQHVLLKFVEGMPPTPLLSVRGETQLLRFSPDAQSLLMLEKRTGESTRQLLLVNTETGAITQVSTDAESADWISAPDAIVSVDHRGGVWYHGLQLSGRIDPPKYIGESRSNPVVLPGEQSLLFVTRNDQQSALSIVTIAKREQHLVTPLPQFPEERTATVRIAPDTKNAIVMLPDSLEQENAVLISVALDTGEVKKQPIIGKDVTWLDEETCIVHRITAGVSQLWLLKTETGETIPLEGAKEGKPIT